jgi:antibiotic biosynthesis monooxygenase (ABM) superfamily enzyme
MTEKPMTRTIDPTGTADPTSTTDPTGATTPRRTTPAGPPSRHQLAVMIWLAVFPTLTVLNLALSDWLATLSPVLRTLTLATIAVPIVVYGVLPQLHRLRGRLLMRATTR